jgi:quercetin dioxygenase-like cupin family protein
VIIVKISFVSLFVFPFMLFAQRTSLPTSVPVENEPMHKVMFKNESVTVIHLTAAWRAYSLSLAQARPHCHRLSATLVAQQKMNEPEGSATSTKPGNISAITLTDASYTHRVHNVGKEPYEVLDIEPDHRPTIPSPDAAAPIAAENPSARVYRWVLAPGATSPMHTHMRPYIIVSVTPINLKMTSPDGQSSSHDVGSGDFRWVDAKVAHTLGNAGTTPGQMIEVELK